MDILWSLISSDNFLFGLAIGVPLGGLVMAIIETATEVLKRANQ